MPAGEDDHVALLTQADHTHIVLGVLKEQACFGVLGRLTYSYTDLDAHKNYKTVSALLLGTTLSSGGGGGWHKASVFGCLPLAAPTGLSPLLILTLCVPERVLVVSTEPPDDLSCLTTPGVGCPGDGAVARAVDQGHPDAHSESMRGFADSSTDLRALGCASAG